MSTRLERRDAANVLEVHEQVVAERIGDVVNQVLHRAFTRHHGLRAAREARHHRKTAVLDFLDTHLRHVGLALAHDVEETTRVCRFAGAPEHLFPADEFLLAHGARVPVILRAAKFSKVHQRGVDPEDRERVGPVIVRALRRDHTRLVPDQAGFLRDDAEAAEHLRGNHTGHTEHCPSTVDHFRVRQPLRVDETTGTFRVGQPERIEPVVARQRAVEVRQRLVRVPEHVQRRELVFSLHKLQSVINLLPLFHNHLLLVDFVH